MKNYPGHWTANQIKEVEIRDGIWKAARDLAYEGMEPAKVLSTLRNLHTNLPKALFPHPEDFWTFIDHEVYKHHLNWLNRDNENWVI